MSDEKRLPLDRRALISRGGALLGGCLLASATSPVSAKGVRNNIPTNDIDVKQFGATGKRKDNATKAFKDAIAACTAQGGGVVNVPAGDYTVGQIELKDHVILHLTAGSSLYLSQSKNDFSNNEPAMIFADNVKNAGVIGRGTMDGLAQYDYTEMRGIDPDINKEIEIARQAGMDMRRYYRKKTALNAYMFVINDCTDFLLEGIRIINSPLWTVKLSDCNRVSVRGIHIYSDLEKGVNADGIDICSSHNVTVSDCVIVTADDSIVLKTISRKGKKANPCENITVTNCVLTSSSTALMIGTETEADIRHVLFNNCVIRNSNKGFGINVQDGATVSDVVFSNLTIETRRRQWNWWGSAEMCKFILRRRKPDSRLGKIENIVVDNIVAHTRGTSTVIGHAEQRMKNISFTNVRISMNHEDAADKRATHALQIDSVAGLRIRDLSIDWEDQTEPNWTSALALKNISDFFINSFQGRQGLKESREPAILIDGCNDGAIVDCKAAPGTGTFISFRGDITDVINVRYADTTKATESMHFESEALRTKVQITG